MSIRVRYFLTLTLSIAMYVQLLRLKALYIVNEIWFYNTGKLSGHESTLQTRNFCIALHFEAVSGCDLFGTTDDSLSYHWFSWWLQRGLVVHSLVWDITFLLSLGPEKY